jgi:VIT1/CCC1 family predicted Fe2+/Mn2+ transporter
MRHEEHHRSERIGWLRAAVMGANDGIVSIASLILGGARRAVGALRVTFWGALAMALTSGVGALFGAVV